MLRKGKFWQDEGLRKIMTEVPCSSCIGCKLEASKQWGTRIWHELMSAEAKGQACSFITLTYNDRWCPINYSLVRRDFQEFMKRLREHKSREKPKKSIRFFMCGEYGEKGKRPHYHACLFGEDFRKDRQLWKTTNAGDRLYTSEELERIWGMGFVTVGDLTFESACYVARYTTKKITGKRASWHYGSRLPEYASMSTKPGIGSEWIHKHMEDTYRFDTIVVRGRECTPPKFYDKMFKKKMEKERTIERYIEIKKKRIERANMSDDNTMERLKIKERIMKRRQIYSREFEE